MATGLEDGISTRQLAIFIIAVSQSNLVLYAHTSPSHQNHLACRKFLITVFDPNFYYESRAQRRVLVCRNDAQCFNEHLDMMLMRNAQELETLRDFFASKTTILIEVTWADYYKNNCDEQ